MPKVKSKVKDIVVKYIREFPNEHFRGDGDVLFCECCSKKVSISQRFQVVQHISTNLHKENKEKKTTMKQTFISSSSGKSDFNTDLCRTFVRADIPFHKLKNPHFKKFLEKYVGQKIPEESTIRKNYLSDIYIETLNKIRNFIVDGPIWVSVDETTDVEGRYVANAIIGKLTTEKTKPMLLNIEILEKCNHATIAQFFNNSMSVLWPNGIQHNNVLLFLSDAAPYMIKAGKALQIFYPKLLHVTCLAHAFHRIAEHIRNEFPEVDSLIANVKKVFLKAPSRVRVLKDCYPDLSLPPQPIITRWGTWLETSIYYNDNFSKIQTVLAKLEDNAVSIAKSKEIMDKRSLVQDLAFISSNFSFLSNKITQLETQNVSLCESIAAVNDACVKLENIVGRYFCCFIFAFVVT